jgi:hypothetical protein
LGTSWLATWCRDGGGAGDEEKRLVVGVALRAWQL